MKYLFMLFLSTLTINAFSESMSDFNRKYCENLQSQITLKRNDALKELSGQSNNQQPGAGPAYAAKKNIVDELENEYKLKCSNESVSNPLDIKRQKCIRLGLIQGSADFQECMK